jgi:hypothetical protein
MNKVNIGSDKLFEMSKVTIKRTENRFGKCVMKERKGERERGGRKQKQRWMERERG